MSLTKYKQKRNLKSSQEPPATASDFVVAKKTKESIIRVRGREGKPSSKKLIFVIHRHEASHLHWDLRLEMLGVLKSWAVPKEPPTTKGEKRLAIQVEDHPLAYANFKGIIPEGNYGAGKVEIWDKGNYELIEKSPTKIEFILRGKKLKGKHLLVKTNYAKNSWLWMKV